MNHIKNKTLIFFVIPFIIYIALLTIMPLMEPDEGRYSAIPSEMNQSGDYTTPHLKGTVYLEKPPLCYWATALLFKIFGENEFSSRLFTALCAWGCIILVYSIGTFFHDKKTGFYAAAVLTTSLYHFAIGRINILDMPLAFFVCAAVWMGYRYFSGSGEIKKWLYLFYLMCALAFLTKGLIGIVFPFAVIVIWLLFSKRWRDILRLFSPVGFVIFLAVAGPWLILVQRANKDFFWFFFVQEHFLRYTTTMHSRSEPVYFFIPIILAGTMPWCAFLWQAVKESGLKIASLFAFEEKVFLITWLGFIFLFFSISSSKLVSYIAPVFLPLAVFMGHLFRVHDDVLRQNLNNSRSSGFLYHIPVILQSLLFIAALLVPAFLKEHGIPFYKWWSWVAVPITLSIALMILPDLIKKKWGGGWFITIYVISFLFFSLLIFPMSKFLTPYKSAYPVAKVVKDYVPAGKELYQYRMSLYGIDFYTKMRTPVVDDIGELRPGVEKLAPEEKARYFLLSDEFFRLYQEKKDIFCATERENVEKLRKKVNSLNVLWNNGSYSIIHLN
ncbi:MAG TPA: glycosyltransferase family 39 protein [Syntrophales bacterium]|nr:glycosyltransferase family 39 protein [Syntrophales bacterium]